MTARIRPTIAAMTPYKPGRSPDDLARELGLPRAIKLASNETAFGPLPSVVDAVARAASTMNRYPDNGSLALVEALAAKLGVGLDRVAVGCGSVSLCQQLIQATVDAGDEVVYGWRSFEAYPLLVNVAGGRRVEIPLRDWAFDLDAMLAAITDRTRLVFVCNPNNPTSTAVRRAELEAFLDAVPPTVLVVLDEAYREFVEDTDVPDGLTFLDRPNVVVLRTFSKAYGLAAMRVGYLAAGDPAIATAARTVQVPFAVTTVAQAAALASLEAEPELMQRVKEIVVERDRVVSSLESIGVTVPQSHANFVWLPLGEEALPFAAACEQRGVIVRPFAGDGVRVTIGAPDENDAFLTIAREALTS